MSMPKRNPAQAIALASLVTKMLEVYEKKYGHPPTSNKEIVLFTCASIDLWLDVQPTADELAKAVN